VAVDSDRVPKQEVFAMSDGTKVFIGVALLLLTLFSAFAAGTVWFPRDVQGAGRGPNSGTGPHPMMGGSSAASSFEEDEPFDRQFIDHMIPHHAMAIRSAQHMISESERQELRELADDIVESQSEQIDRMRAWREEWYGDPGPAYAYPGDGLSDGMMDRGGMMDGADAMFLRMMIPHHEQAIEMSREAMDMADHPEIRQLAEQIIAEQTAEIELMRGYLREID
jgi:uncharacterized protein (DUF305 family)